LAKYNESDDSIVGEIVVGVIGVAAAGVAAWFGKKNLPKIKEGLGKAKESIASSRLGKAVSAGIEDWKSSAIETEIPEQESSPDIQEVETVPTPVKEAPKPNLKKCSRNCGTVLQKKELEVGVCLHCQSKMKCKSCTNPLIPTEWEGGLCSLCLAGTQCTECHAITKPGQGEKHATSCSKKSPQTEVPSMASKIVIDTPVEAQEDFLEALEQEVANIVEETPPSKLPAKKTRARKTAS
jgi:hypothetical protein